MDWELLVNLKPYVLCLLFGMLTILTDFNDSPIHGWIGNLDQIFGSGPYYYAAEIAYPSLLIALFLIFGKVTLDLGKGERRAKAAAPATALKLKLTVILLIFLTLLSLIELDDINDVLGLQLALGKEYWLAMQAIFPIGSIATFLAFGKVCSNG